jgi:sterol desaturase/sphingolipid hydroxylase (fatty acid hydroxylase superfamily)
MTERMTFVLAALPILVFAMMVLLEWRWPRRALVLSRVRRWTTHALLFAANRLTIWILARLVAVPLVAFWANGHGYGLLKILHLPFWVEALIAFILLDFAMWVQHLATHKIPVLWRMHRVHHADRDLDVSTAIRFHPFEIIVSTAWKASCVVALGVPALVFLAFEAWLGANALFNHSNVELPRWLDRVIRPFLVTPDMHLVHHSILPREQQRNYGFALTIWDRLFGTYGEESELGRDIQPIGLADISDARPAQIGWSLKFPLT